MSKKLYICEKPSQARDISRVLGVKKKHESHIEGSDIIVTWCLGHLLESAKPDYYCKELKPWRIEKLPIIPETWHMEPVGRVKKQLQAVKKLIKSTNHIVIATDADREGELIARELMEYCRYQGTVERLWLSALDDVSIKKALKTIKPGSTTENLYHAGLGRQRADWIVGMNMTMGTSSLFGKFGEGVLSVGRVQTPTLQLIVDRDRAIEQFKSQDYYELYAKFIDDSNVGIWLKWAVPDALKDNEPGRCLDITAVKDIATKIHAQPAVITKLTKQKKRLAAPLPFSLSALQKKASSLYGFTAKKTLSVAQELYEKYKITTYPRTDCGYLPASQFSDSKDVLDTLLQNDSTLADLIGACDTQFKSSAWNDKKVTAHHGIIPTTNNKVNLSSMPDDALKIFHLIRSVYIAQFLGDFEYKHTKIIVSCEQEQFTATGKIPLVQGWKKALEFDKSGTSSKGEDETTQDLPDWTQGQSLLEEQEKMAKKKTKSPGRFTEGTLIGAMESVGRYVEDPKLKKVLKETSGIGTQATRAAIIETLIKRDYITRDKKKLISSEKGRALVDLLPKEVTDPATTARWEQDLEEVAAGNLALDLFLANQNKGLSEMLKALNQGNAQAPQSNQNLNVPSSKHKCQSCDKPMARRKVKNKNSYFWGCTGYPECKITLPDFKGKPGKKKTAAKKTEHACPKCKTGYLVERKSARGKFYGCSGYPKCKNIEQDISTTS
tara:strand:- start:21141 stop:23306 length:2166 start_codon:yes stop_codon:yes gene_type:complete